MGGAGIIYLLVVGRWLLPDRRDQASLLPRSEDRHFMADILIPLDSPLVGKQLKDAGFTEERGLRVFDLIRRDASLRDRLDDLDLQAGDRLVVRSNVGDMLGLRDAGDVAFGGVGLMPSSRWAHTKCGDGGGRRPAMAISKKAGGGSEPPPPLRRHILAIHRRAPTSPATSTMPASTWAIPCFRGSAESMKRLFENQDLVNLTQPSERPLRRGKAPIAIAAVLLVMGLAAFDVLPISRPA